MSVSVYKPGDFVPLSITFQNSLGGDTEVINATVEILYIDNNGNPQIILERSPMRKQSQTINGMYGFLWRIPENAPTTKYFVNFRAELPDGTITTGEDTFLVVNATNTSSAPGEVLKEISAEIYGLNVVDSSGRPIPNVEVLIYNRQTGAFILKTTTDVAGGFVVFLAPGSYLFRYSKSGYAPQIIEKVVE